MVLPVTIFFSSLCMVLLHLNILQVIFGEAGGLLAYLLGTSKAEAVCAVANVMLSDRGASPRSPHHWQADTLTVTLPDGRRLLERCGLYPCRIHPNGRPACTFIAYYTIERSSYYRHLEAPSSRSAQEGTQNAWRWW